MSKKTKKRNKPYTGIDAAPNQPVVHRYSAVVRSPINQWWFDHKKRIKTFSLIGGGVLLLGWLLYEFFMMLF
jgi:hypothetical protein